MSTTEIIIGLIIGIAAILIAQWITVKWNLPGGK